MNLQVVSIKQLRENLPKIREGLKKNQAYLLIYRSQPLATLKPVGDNFDLELKEKETKKPTFLE